MEPREFATDVPAATTRRAEASAVNSIPRGAINVTAKALYIDARSRVFMMSNSDWKKR